MSFLLSLSPADSLFTGDGRPFNQYDTGRAIAASVFPPLPDTLYGAARVACARALGWDGAGEWGADIARIMGSWDKQGHFEISGPFFRAEGEPLLPVPSHIVLQSNEASMELVMRTPANEAIRTDLGKLRLPEIPPYEESTKCQSLAGRWGKASAILSLLAGKNIAPDDLGMPRQHSIPSQPNVPKPLRGWSIDDLAAPEYRVGIARDKATRMVEEGQLYATVRRALRPGVEMLVEVDGMDWPEDLDVAVQFGGESRFVFAGAGGSAVSCTESPPVGNYLVYCATPVVMEPPVPGEPVANLPGTLVMASISGIASHSGRQKNSDGKGSRPHSNMVLPAGSVLLMEGQVTPSDFPARLGEKTHMGYGRFFTGEWK